MGKPQLSIEHSPASTGALETPSAFAVLHAPELSLALERLPMADALRLREQVDGVCRALAILELVGPLAEGSAAMRARWPLLLALILSGLVFRWRTIAFDPAAGECSAAGFRER